MRELLLGLLAGAVVAAFFLLRKKPSAHVKRGWRIEWSPGMPATLDAQNGFNFPTNPGSHVHYVQNFDPPNLEPGKSIRVRFRVSGQGFTAQEWPDEPATVSLLIQRKGDDWTARGKMASYRWFSGQQVTLAEGEHTMTIPLDVAHWGDVYGGRDPELFAQALQNAESVGLVFGSASGRGHGVYATQQSRFSIESVQPAV